MKQLHSLTTQHVPPEWVLYTMAYIVTAFGSCRFRYNPLPRFHIGEEPEYWQYQLAPGQNWQYIYPRLIPMTPANDHSNTPENRERALSRIIDMETI